MSVVQVETAVPQNLPGIVYTEIVFGNCSVKFVVMALIKVQYSRHSIKISDS